MLRKKALFSLIALSFCQAMFAQTQDCCLPVYRPGDSIACELPPGYMYPAEYAVDPDLFVSVEFLYWEANKGARNSIGSNVHTVGTEIDTTILFHDAGYVPGFKIDAGFGLPCWDNWVVYTAYTWLHHTTTTNKSAKPGDVISGPVGFTPANISASRVQSKYKFNIDFVEANVGRPMYVNERLIFNPFFGLKGYWMDQNQTVTYTLTNAALPGISDDGTKLWAIGPYGGMSVQGLLWYGVYLVGKIDLIAPFVKFTKSSVTQDYVFGTTNTHTITRRTQPYGNWPIGEASLGLGWGAYFGCNNHIDIVVTYDFVNSIPAVSPNNTFTPSEFYIQGLSVKGQWNF